MKPAPDNTTPPSSFAGRYPNLSWLVTDGVGWIELGSDNYSSSMVRVLDPGGILWEGKNSYASMDDLLADAERELAKFRREEGL